MLSMSSTSSVPVGQAGSSKDSKVCDDGFSSLNQLSMFEGHVFTLLNLTKCSCIDDNNKGAKIGISVDNSVRTSKSKYIILSSWERKCFCAFFSRQQVFIM